MNNDDAARRYTFEESLTLTYNHKGWALIGNGTELIASDKASEHIDRTPYRDGKTLLAVIREIIEKDLGTPVE